MIEFALPLTLVSGLREHPLAELIPEMRPAEWRAFLADVAERGILEPIRLAPNGVTVLDGRHRLRAARELGIEEVPTAPALCEPGDEATYMLRAALHRRHLSDDQRAILGARLAAAMSAERSRAQRQAAIASRWADNAHAEVDTGRTGVIHPVSMEPKTREIAAAFLGVSERRLRMAQGLARDAPDLAGEVGAGKLPLLVARAKVERQQALAELAAQSPGGLPEGAEVWDGDCFTVAERIPSSSIDLILTDPPWPGDWLEFWPQLGELAARVLKPGGFAIVYLGHMRLPAEIDGLLAGGLEWHWLAAITLRGSHPAIRARSARTMFRPVAILRQPGGGEAPWFSDLFSTDPMPQKNLHPWQQSLGPARGLIRRFSLPGQLVLDPLCGAGTFPLAAIMEGRRALGIERDAAHAAVARARIAQAALEVRLRTA